MEGEAESMGAPSSSTRPDTAETDVDRESKGEDDIDATFEEVDELVDSKPKKKRRVIKTADKKYQCPQPDCGKSYSRAEHLYRHQLNHQPKQIYHCDFPGCDRHFVRADLCARHRERHTAKGSHLQRKDAFLNSQKVPLPHGPDVSSSSGLTTMIPSPVQPDPSAHSSTPVTTSYPSHRGGALPFVAGPIHYVAPPLNNLTPVNSEAGTHLDPQLPTNASYGTYAATQAGHPHPMGPPLSPTSTRRFGYEPSYQRPPSYPTSYQTGPSQTLAINTLQPPQSSSPASTGPLYGQPAYTSPSISGQYRSPTSYPQLPSLPPFGFPQGYAPPSSNRSGSVMTSPPTINSAEQHPVPNSRSNSIADFSALDQMATAYTMPVFGHDGFPRSPTAIVDDTFWDSLLGPGGFDMPYNPSPPAPDHMQNPPVFNVSLPKLEPDATPTSQPLPSTKTADTPIRNAETPAESTGLDITMRESKISEQKQARLAEQVRSWSDIEQNPGRKMKDEFLVGSENDPNHALSLQMLKTYLTSYWVHTHQQMPILHRPTFNPETCPDLLLLAMMCLGASCLERTHQPEVVQNCSEWAFFAAYHIRWEVFKDVEFRPTAKLWTFQTLLLLELFEKMYSTRVLHERAHIHHATTLTVMRRGSSLLGRSSTSESPAQGGDPTRTPPGPDGTINTSGQNTPDAFWNRWITAEATRRVAFAAFIIDSTHATLFGHSAVMSPHELKLPLPCDEALWAAASGAEVQRVEASLAANGFKPTTFLDGLKKTLNGQKVRTNTFGRIVLMAGLLNISWHMNQRDLQVQSLGASNTLGTQSKWRTPLIRAFDFWRRDFDESLSTNEHWQQLCGNTRGPSGGPDGVSGNGSIDFRDNIFESRACLHSLAHMAMHVDIVDCLVFAGADRVLGRLVTDPDRTAVQKRMREQWAPSARARDAVFYALRFLCEILLPDDDAPASKTARPRPTTAPGGSPTFCYSARDDFLLNRPWILYFSVLIVWSYGYALDGPIRPSNYTLTTRELQVFDMRRYLLRVGNVTSPDDLEKQKDRNSCLGLLLLLRECFKQPRWELLHEANDVLGSCVDLLLPGYNGGGEFGAKAGGLMGV